MPAESNSSYVSQRSTSPTKILQLISISAGRHLQFIRHSLSKKSSWQCMRIQTSRRLKIGPSSAISRTDSDRIVSVDRARPNRCRDVVEDKLINIDGAEGVNVCEEALSTHDQPEIRLQIGLTAFISSSRHVR